MGRPPDAAFLVTRRRTAPMKSMPDSMLRTRRSAMVGSERVTDCMRCSASSWMRE